MSLSALRSRDRMKEPAVATATGLTYDRPAITRWINERGIDPHVKILLLLQHTFLDWTPCLYSAMVWIFIPAYLFCTSMTGTTRSTGSLWRTSPLPSASEKQS